MVHVTTLISEQLTKSLSDEYPFAKSGKQFLQRMFMFIWIYCYLCTGFKHPQILGYKEPQILGFKDPEIL